MNHIKQICKDPAKVDQKLQGKQFLLGRYFSLKANCRHRSKKDKKFQRSKRQRILEIQTKLNQEEFQQARKKQKLQGLKQAQKSEQCGMLDQKEQIKQSPLQQCTQPIDYKYFEPLHRLWEGYMQDLIGGEKNEQSVSLKILRGDLVGAKIQVIYSKVQSYIGQKGIIIKQTLRSFVVVKTPRENQQTKPFKSIISLLKSEIIFLLRCGDRSFVVNGNTLIYRPSDRSKHKFKFRIGEKLNIQFLGNFIQNSQ